MTTDPALTLAQWFSPGFPVGGFAYSHGLEWVIEQGEMTTAHDLHHWVETLLVDGTGRNDAVFIVAGHDAQSDPELLALNDLCMAYASGRGRRIETVEQGAAFAHTLREMGLRHLPDLSYPVAVGHAAALNALPLDMTLRFYLQAFAANMVSAAVRRVPLGQSDGQRVLAAVQPVVLKVAEKALHLQTNDLYSNSFMAEIAGMNQETLYARVFRS